MYLCNRFLLYIYYIFVLKKNTNLKLNLGLFNLISVYFGLLGTKFFVYATKKITGCVIVLKSKELNQIFPNQLFLSIILYFVKEIFLLEAYFCVSSFQMNEKIVFQNVLTNKLDITNIKKSFNIIIIHLVILGSLWFALLSF